jgi:transposase
MPVMHVAAMHGLSWLTVRRAEERAIERWEATRSTVPLRLVGVDEKWLGRRHNLEHKFVTIVSNLETGEPVWIGKGRSEDTLKRWLQSLSHEQKATIALFAMDMHRAYWNAVDNTRGLEHAAIVHDPFHVMKLAGQMLDELRREVTVPNRTPGALPIVARSSPHAGCPSFARFVGAARRRGGALRLVGAHG